MQNLTKAQNTIILVSLENFLADCKSRQPEFKAQIAELVEIYNNIA
tara:strand:+ start:322 stop:459 length:138 start_codon:yes stop_codon:yes gene_type:complete